MRKDRILKVMEKVKGILPGDHPHVLIDAVKMAEGPYIEIGALCGASTIAIALASLDDRKVISVDPFRIEYLSPMAKDVVKSVSEAAMLKGESFFGAWKKQVDKWAGDKNIHPVVGDRIEVLGRVKTLLDGEKAGFLFIDGLHTYEAVRDELIHYLPLMKDGAIVAFHDYAPDWGLYKAVNEAIEDGRLEVVVDHYLLVTRVKHG